MNEVTSREQTGRIKDVTFEQIDVLSRHALEMYELIEQFGNKTADVLEQMIRGQWVDELDHKVAHNTAMIELKETLDKAISLRYEIDRTSEA